NRYARWALAQGLGKGETVCLLMPNRPEYMAIWLGITRVGGVAALINGNLVGASLAHSIDVVAPRHIIVADELVGALQAAQPHIAAGAKSANKSAKIWSHGGDAVQFPDIEDELARLSPAPLSDVPPPTVTDRALYIYTSGTTGLPKAAKVNHYRLLIW